MLEICPIMVNNQLASWGKFTNIFISSIRDNLRGKKIQLVQLKNKLVGWTEGAKSLFE